MNNYLNPMCRLSRSFSTANCTVPSGLYCYNNFLTESKKNILQEKAIELYQKIQMLHPQRASSIRLSKNHNLPNREYYKVISMVDEESKISAQHFEKYGDEGHTLTYFIGNAQIPKFIRAGLIARIATVPIVQEWIKNKTIEEKVSWNFTFNTYSLTNQKGDDQMLAGFPFHKDIASNGEITAIYSMGAAAEFEIRNPEHHAQKVLFSLEDNSLVLLSGAARWHWEHRVLPSPLNTSSSLSKGEKAIHRISLVLGVQ